MSEQLQGEDEMTGLTLTVPEELLLQFEDLARCAVADALTAHRQTADEGFLDVDGAAAFLASTPAAIRSLVKRREFPFHKAPNGRLLFVRRELDSWVRSR
jgi:hypothetical protein